MATKVGLGSFNNFGHIPSGLVAFQFMNNLFFFSVYNCTLSLDSDLLFDFF